MLGSLFAAFTTSKIAQIGNGSKSTEVEFITDFIHHDLCKSILLVAFVCWTTVERAFLLHQTSQNNIFASVYNTEDTEYVEHYAHSENLIFLTDLDCENSTKILSIANTKNLFSAPYKWLLLTSNDKFIVNYTKHFLSYNFFVDSNVVLAHQTSGNEYSLMEFYKYTNESEYMVKKNTTKWISRNGFTDFRLRSLPQLNRQNLNGTVLKAFVVFVNNDSMNHLSDYRFNYIDPVSKANYILTNHLADLINFSVEFTFVNDFGYINPKDNMFTGMIGALQRNQAEIGSSSLFLTSDRVEVVDFIAQTSLRIIVVKFIFRQPPLSYVSNIFTLPFSRGVWLCSFSLCILTSVLLYIAVALEWHTNLGEDNNSMLPSLSEAFMVTIGAVAQQGATSEPRTGAGKFLMFLTFMSLMFIYVSFSASIVGLLQSPATNINTLEDLLKSKLELGVQDIPYMRYYFEHATTPVQKAIYGKLAPKGQKPRYLSTEEGTIKVRKGLFAFHGEHSRIYKYTQDHFFEEEKCGLKEIAYIGPTYPYQAIRKNSTIKELLKLGFRKFEESGLQKRLGLRFFTKKPDCISTGGNFVVVGLIDIYAAFILLVCGMAISLSLLLIEIVLYKNLSKKSLKRPKMTYYE